MGLMTDHFAIEPRWLSVERSGPEGATEAELAIRVGGDSLLSVEDGWAQSLRETVRVSAWPLANWLLANWWRLRWEVASPRRDHVSFRMAHELAAVGAGYLWPRIVLSTDGESIEVRSSPSRRALAEPVRFLSTVRRTIPAQDFEAGVFAFLEVTLARLDALGHSESDLHRLFAEVQAERQDEDSRRFRRLEAELGLDPDEVAPEIIERFDRAREEIGEDSLNEIAALRGVDPPQELLKSVSGLARLNGVRAAFEPLRAASRQLARARASREEPWARGRVMARAVRKYMGVGNAPLSNAELGELIGARIPSRPTAPSDAPLSLGVPEPRRGEYRLIFRKRNPAGIRFEAARFLGDFARSGGTEHWLPITDADSARQKFQRSFAAEFLAPIDAVVDRLGGVFADDAIERVADEFQISPLAVRSSLANHGFVSPDEVRAPVELASSREP
jgi:hypothetical protein